jgi:hypothetical protein
LTNKRLQQILDAICDHSTFARFSEAGSRPSDFAAKTICAAMRAWCSVMRQYNPIVYFRSLEVAPGVTLTPKPGRPASQ